MSRPLGVILTARRAVFICGETEAIVPLTIVPVRITLGLEGKGRMRKGSSCVFLLLVLEGSRGLHGRVM